ncbi:hypothetical protein PHJA_000295000 [Phtheirospermum japonicum]|uniref:Uncharacterized protein n=1 Tax=Phtheirospermum japonicum TaxID=374723 RepID=A0A830B304_9LAMI|nr:hypothetical protein PHJA_000295000 [Phtheirospermum japonicum]
MSTETYDNHPYDLPKGPSPIIPLLVVLGLCLLLRGHSSSFNLDRPLFSHSQNAIFIFIPILLLVITYSTSHTIILPLALILVLTYTVSTMLHVPLMLILIVYLAGTYLAFGKYNSEEIGWVCVLLLVFVLLHWVLSVERHQTGALVLGVVIFLCFHCFT